ncbi:hypothetical protein GS453_14390 [Rhodococcus hoagii]|uniref:Uncharacterized protein n=1 Tax=Rhodococcus hoagii TaxID=43767 RepID=A0AAP2ANI0_RHOHA|nr:hypothetical protein [Prescottella equi]
MQQQWRSSALALPCRPALNAVPTANYQMCGTVYTGGSWVANAAPPSAATGVS